MDSVVSATLLEPAETSLREFNPADVLQLKQKPKLLRLTECREMTKSQC